MARSFLLKGFLIVLSLCIVFSQISAFADEEDWVHHVTVHDDIFTFNTKDVTSADEPTLPAGAGGILKGNNGFAAVLTLISALLLWLALLLLKIRSIVVGGIGMLASRVVDLFTPGGTSSSVASFGGGGAAGAIAASTIARNALGNSESKVSGDVAGMVSGRPNTEIAEQAKGTSFATGNGDGEAVFDDVSGNAESGAVVSGDTSTDTKEFNSEVGSNAYQSMSNGGEAQKGHLGSAAAAQTGTNGSNPKVGSAIRQFMSNSGGAQKGHLGNAAAAQTGMVGSNAYQSSVIDKELGNSVLSMDSLSGSSSDGSAINNSDAHSVHVGGNTFGSDVSNGSQGGNVQMVSGAASRVNSFSNVQGGLTEQQIDSMQSLGGGVPGAQPAVDVGGSGNVVSTNVGAAGMKNVAVNQDSARSYASGGDNIAYGGSSSSSNESKVAGGNVVNNGAVNKVYATNEAPGKPVSGSGTQVTNIQNGGSNQNIVNQQGGNTNVVGQQTQVGGSQAQGAAVPGAGGIRGVQVPVSDGAQRTYGSMPGQTVGQGAAGGAQAPYAGVNGSRPNTVPGTGSVPDGAASGVNRNVASGVSIPGATSDNSLRAVKGDMSAPGIRVGQDGVNSTQTAPNGMTMPSRGGVGMQPNGANVVGEQNGRYRNRNSSDGAKAVRPDETPGKPVRVSGGDVSGGRQSVSGNQTPSLSGTSLGRSGQNQNAAKSVSPLADRSNVRPVSESVSSGNAARMTRVGGTPSVDGGATFGSGNGGSGRNSFGGGHFGSDKVQNVDSNRSYRRSSSDKNQAGMQQAVPGGASTGQKDYGPGNGFQVTRGTATGSNSYGNGMDYGSGSSGMTSNAGAGEFVSNKIQDAGGHFAQRASSNDGSGAFTPGGRYAQNPGNDSFAGQQGYGHGQNQQSQDYSGGGNDFAPSGGYDAGGSAMPTRGSGGSANQPTYGYRVAASQGYGGGGVPAPGYVPPRPGGATYDASAISAGQIGGSNRGATVVNPVGGKKSAIRGRSGGGNGGTGSVSV